MLLHRIRLNLRHKMRCDTAYTQHCTLHRSVSRCIGQSHDLTLHRSVSRCTGQFHFASVSLALHRSVSLCTGQSHTAPVSLTLHRSVSLHQSVSHCIGESHSASVSLTLHRSVSLCTGQSHSAPVSLTLHRSVSHCSLTAKLFSVHFDICVARKLNRLLCVKCVCGRSCVLQSSMVGVVYYCRRWKELCITVVPASRVASEYCVDVAVCVWHVQV